MRPAGASARLSWSPSAIPEPPVLTPFLPSCLLLAPAQPDESTGFGWLVPGWAVAAACVAGLGLAVLWLQWKLRDLIRRNLALEAQAGATAKDLDAARRSLEAASIMDPVTGLQNRRFLELYLPDDLAQAQRAFRDLLSAGRDPLDAREDLLLYLLEVDYFKQVVDTWGPAAGDAVLIQLAQALRRATRKTDFRIRWDGARILIVARRSRRAGAPRVAQNLLAAVRELPFHLPNGETILKRISIGYAAMPFHPRHPEVGSWQQAVGLAEQCLGAARETGRDRCVGITIKPTADPQPLRETETWSAAWGLERELMEAACSEPGFAWPRGQDGYRPSGG